MIRTSASTTKEITCILLQISLRRSENYWNYTESSLCGIGNSGLTYRSALSLTLLVERTKTAINEFNVHGFLHRKNILIYIQQDATLQFILSGNCSTCFGWYHHPSSGAQTTVSTASGICHTVIAICHPQHTQTSSNSSTIAADSNNGATNTTCCRYSCLRS